MGVMYCDCNHYILLLYYNGMLHGRLPITPWLHTSSLSLTSYDRPCMYVHCPCPLVSHLGEQGEFPWDERAFLTYRLLFSRLQAPFTEIIIKLLEQAMGWSPLRFGIGSRRSVHPQSVSQIYFACLVYNIIIVRYYPFRYRVHVTVLRWDCCYNALGGQLRWDCGWRKVYLQSNNNASTMAFNCDIIHRTIYQKLTFNLLYIS